MDTTPQPNEPRPSMLAGPKPKPALPKHLQDEPTVTMIFPKALSLNLDEYMGRVQFEAGLQEVPVSLATEYPQRDTKGRETGKGMHWYLLQQGVKKYVPVSPPVPEITERHVQFLASQGHTCSTVEGAKRIIASFPPAKQASFFAASEWTGEPKPAPVDDDNEVNLSAMTKAEIVDYAQAKLGLALDPAMTKNAMIAAVEEKTEAAA